MMPLRLVFVRHGKSEGNLATDLLEAGRYDEVPEALRQAPGWQWRLTPSGQEQAIQAGAWIRANISETFGRAYVSWYPRALETAGLLGLKGDIWRTLYYLRERDWGELETLPQNEEEAQQHLAQRAQRRQNRVFWCPPSGETLADVILRMDRFFDTLHRECSEEEVLVVMHGEAMWAACIILERLSPAIAQERMNSPSHRIGNCHILDYSRIDPVTGEKTDHLNWLRHIDPLNPPQDPTACWRRLERLIYSGEELLSLAHRYPAFFEG